MSDAHTRTYSAHVHMHTHEHRQCTHTGTQCTHEHAHTCTCTCAQHTHIHPASISMCMFYLHQWNRGSLRAGLRNSVFVSLMYARTHTVKLDRGCLPTRKSESTEQSPRVWRPQWSSGPGLRQLWECEWEEASGDPAVALMSNKHRCGEERSGSHRLGDDRNPQKLKRLLGSGTGQRHE